MITDIFSRRYSHTTLFKGFFKEDRVFLNQMATTITQHLWMGQNYTAKKPNVEIALTAVHNTLALELGHQTLSAQWFQNTIGGWTQYTYPQMCSNFLLASPPTDAALADEFIKDRLSFVELAYRQKGWEVETSNRGLANEIAQAEVPAKLLPTRGVRVPGKVADGIIATNKAFNQWWTQAVQELNERLRLGQYPLTYHNGLIQLSRDATATAQIATPFWPLVAGAKWGNVDTQMKEAMDRRDSGDRTAAFHAVCALESAIKIISNEKGWTTGNERGAANYIDNLVSTTNGRFIQVWESEALKALFKEVRNPSAPGPGQTPPPVLSPHQTDWAIDTSMAWIKSLVKRM